MTPRVYDRLTLCAMLHVAYPTIDLWAQQGLLKPCARLSGLGRPLVYSDAALRRFVVKRYSPRSRLPENLTDLIGWVRLRDAVRSRDTQDSPGIVRAIADGRVSAVRVGHQNVLVNPRDLVLVVRELRPYLPKGSRISDL